MNWKAVGTITKTIYVIGSHAECVRIVNERISIADSDIRSNTPTSHREPIRIVKEGETVLTEAEQLEQTEKELLMMEIRHKEEKAEKAKKVREERKKALLAKKEAEAAGIKLSVKEKRQNYDETVKEQTAGKVHYWTDEEMKVIAELDGKFTIREINAQLFSRTGHKRTQAALKYHMGAMRKAGELAPRQDRKPVKAWTDSETEFVLENYGMLQVQEIAKLINRTPNQLSSHIARLRKKGIIEEVE